MTTPIHVLIVEDSEPDAELVLRELRRGGYEPEYEVVDCPEGMAAALDKPWDVIISDYVMPHFSGLDALSMVQQRGLDIPFIMVSGKIGEDIAINTMLAGAKDYVLKGSLSRLAPATRRELIDSRRRRKAEEARRRAQEALTEAYDEQERRIAERTSELGQANWMLSQEITERKKAEMELASARADAERREAELRSFMASMADGVIVLNADGAADFINDSGRQILGIPEGKKPTGFLADYKRFTLDGTPIPLEQVPAYRALSHGETVTDARFRFVTPQGRDTYLSVSSSPIMDPQGRIIGAVVVFRDAAEQVELERQREDLYDREHRIAQMLQSALVPPMASIDIKGCRAALKYEPAMKEAEVGGDFYDLFELRDGRVGIVIGDIAGKGLAAAVYVAAAKHAIRSYAYLFTSPAEVMRHANEALCRAELAQQMETSMLTALFAVVDARAATMTYANAGHEPPIIRHADGSIEELEGTDVVLGIVCGRSYTDYSHSISPGDTVVMLTDGITEARVTGALLFGMDGVLRYLSENPALPLADIPSGLLEAARAFGGGKLQDDAAIVAFQCSADQPGS